MIADHVSAHIFKRTFKTSKKNVSKVGCSVPRAGKVFQVYSFETKGSNELVSDSMN